ncbi:MAG: hypothetical protein IJD52_05205 [Alphaproteobacteria bacterium]|nr:hypothetical protein [Alphaproteobacteria bacterium]
MKNKILCCSLIIISFVLGFALGVCSHVAHIKFAPSDVGLCSDGSDPDKHGCCAGEIYTDMNDLGFNCCPEVGGDCYPPLR